ncbi:Sugar (and other) transporter/Major Facilitator Superfamily [Leishmania donovani]|nr:Sugar (and other) transporter/Major Facilitator Superfamily [Leishmania donovani]
MYIYIYEYTPSVNVRAHLPHLFHSPVVNRLCESPQRIKNGHPPPPPHTHTRTRAEQPIMPATLMNEKGDPWRWVVLALFCLYSASNAIQWITYSSIATATRTFFDLTTNQLNMLSSVYMIVFVVGAYFTCTTFERWGVRRGVLIGCELNAMGSILKVAPGLQKPCYLTLVVPQTLNSIAQLFVLSTPPLIAAQYFAPHQRTFATAIAATANSLGNAIALFAPPLIVRSSTGTTKEFMLLFCLEMGFCVLITVGVFLFLRPPSFKAPSQALLGELASAEGRAASGRAQRPVAQQLHQRRGDREEGVAPDELQSEACSNVQNGDRSSVEDKNDDSGVGAGRGRAVAHGQRHTASGEPIASHISACAGARGNNTSVNRPVVEFADAEGTAKPGGGAYSAQEVTLDPSPDFYTEFDRGSMSKHKAMTMWHRLRHNEHVITFLEVGHTIYLLLCRRDFVFLLGAFSISMGSVWTYASVLAQILEPFGVAAELAGGIGAFNVIVGTVVSYLVGLWVDRTRHYKYPLLVCLMGSVLCCIGLIIIMLKAPSHTRTMDGLCSFIYIFAGVFQNTAIPICFEFAMEISYPLPESVPGALLMAGANLCSLIMLSVASMMLGNGVASTSACVSVLILITCVCVVGAILAVFPREKLYRRDAEVEARQQLVAASADSYAASTAATRQFYANSLTAHPHPQPPLPLSGLENARRGAPAPLSGATGKDAETEKEMLPRAARRPSETKAPPAVVAVCKSVFADDELLDDALVDARQLQNRMTREEMNGGTPGLAQHQEEEMCARHR